jgi:hypothetical protein
MKPMCPEHNRAYVTRRAEISNGFVFQFACGCRVTYQRPVQNALGMRSSEAP